MVPRTLLLSHHITYHNYCRVPSASSPSLAFGSGMNSRFSKSLADEISTLSFIDAAVAANNAAALDEAHLAAQAGAAADGGVGGGSTGNIPASAATRGAIKYTSQKYS